ncbi:MAG: DUF3788 domain-containing protein [Lachnospiraceae bacterium]|nr:DUF3788 domain-containing protein [Lachnospiraceae bacterium]
MDWKTLYTKENTPSLEQFMEYIENPLWIEFHDWIQSVYEVAPRMEYSRCSMQPGWNIKYKKGGKSLCTLYPMEGYFITLVVIGNKELTEAEFLMPSCSTYVQEIFRDTETGNGQKWMMIEVRDKAVMEDVFKLINLRKPLPRKVSS